MDKASSDLERACSQMAKKTALRNKDRARVKTLLVERSEIDARLSLDVDHGVARLELARRLKAIATQLRGIERRYKLEPL